MANAHGLIWCKKCEAIVGCAHRANGKPFIYVTGPSAMGHDQKCEHDRNKDWQFRIWDSGAASMLPAPE